MSMKENLTVVYETVLGVPKMEEEVKATFKLTRKQILLISQLIDEGLGSTRLTAIFPADSFAGLKAMQTDLLAQAKFSQKFIENWNSLTEHL